MSDFRMAWLFATISCAFTVVKRKDLQTTLLTIIPAAKPKHPVLTACLFILCHDEIGNSPREFPLQIIRRNRKILNSEKEFCQKI